MTNIEMAELVKKTSIYDIAEKTINPKLSMSSDEKEVAEQLDEWARKIGETGHDPEHQIAQFVTRTVRDEFYDAPNELLDSMFDRGTVGEFDDYEAKIEPIKNTLVAYESAMGGNVPKHYLDYSVLKPTWSHIQVR